MPFEPFRFVHAANLRLDATLQCTVALPESDQAAVEDATLTAFQHVVAECIDHNVDFLLLTCNSFIERDRSLRARLALRDGFRELHAGDIPVFVVPGEQDPPEAWQAIPELPDNVTVCYPSNPEPVAVVRDGRVIATVANTLLYGAADHFGIKVSPTTGDRRPYRIGMLHPSRLAELESASRPDEDEFREDLSADDDFDVSDQHSADLRHDAETPGDRSSAEADESVDPDDGTDHEHALAGFLRQALVDYAVLAGQVHRRTMRLSAGLAHWPGSTQPLAPSDHGVHGVTLIEVDATGTATPCRLSTVVARWKAFEIAIPSDLDPTDVPDMCRARLLEEPREDSESIWLVTWTLIAPSALIEDLASREFPNGLAASLEAQRVPGEPRCVHSIRVFPAGSDGSGIGHSPLAEQFAGLADHLRIDEQHLQAVIARGTGELGWDERLRALVSKLDIDLVSSHVRRLGGQWFAHVGAELEADNLPAADDEREPPSGGEIDSTEESA